MMKVSGNLIDVHLNSIYSADVVIENDRIIDIVRSKNIYENFILPGFVDSHIHIESSMLVPCEFAKAAVKFGTVAVVCDPHEIANVLGVEGVLFMIENGNKANFKFNWCVPSCVPATTFEHSGAVISSKDVEYLFDSFSFVALAEMMNFPGVIFDNQEVLQKIAIAKKYNKPIDGHAPGLTGNDLKKYVSAGILTDHECSSLEEAIEKINLGMFVLIRNGSAAKNYKTLAPLVDLFPDKVMFCSDDLHPENLIQGHIDKFIKEGLRLGLNLFNLLKVACVNPVLFYGLPIGLLRVGDKADFCVIDNLDDFSIKETWINGVKCFGSDVKRKCEGFNDFFPNNFYSRVLNFDDIQIKNEYRNFKAISVTDGELITKVEFCNNISTEMYLNSDVNRDILKLVAVNRYAESNPAVCFVKNFGLKRGAIACTVAHDSHNLIAVGVDDSDIIFVINKLMEIKGGIIASNKGDFTVLPLPVAGLLSDLDANSTAIAYEAVNTTAKSYGTNLNSPFMTLSFLSLLVIPELKLSDKGLFDGIKFEFTSLFI